MCVIKIARFDCLVVFSAGVVYRIYCQPSFFCKHFVPEFALTCIKFLTQETQVFGKSFWYQIVDGV